jgi:hypothetical protein
LLLFEFEYSVLAFVKRLYWHATSKLTERSAAVNLAGQLHSKHIGPASNITPANKAFLALKRLLHVEEAKAARVV